jgi:hypothetical protein
MRLTSARSSCRLCKETGFLSLVVVLACSTFPSACSSEKRYTEETIDGLRHVHNIEPLWGTDGKIALEFIRKYGDSNTDDERGLLYYPADVAVDGEGCVLILDAGNHKIKKFGIDGTVISSFGTKGSGPGEFNGPTRLDICPDGDILVNDLAANAVNIFGRNGRLLGRIDNEGLSPGQILALRSGEIAVIFRRTKSPAEKLYRNAAFSLIFTQSSAASIFRSSSARRAVRRFMTTSRIFTRI